MCIEKLAKTLWKIPKFSMQIIFSVARYFPRLSNCFAYSSTSKKLSSKMLVCHLISLDDKCLHTQTINAFSSSRFTRSKISFLTVFLKIRIASKIKNITVLSIFFIWRNSQYHSIITAKICSFFLKINLFRLKIF